MTTVAIGDPYVDLLTLKSQLGIPDSNTTQDTILSMKLDSASDDVNRWCHRQFGRLEVATSRTARCGISGVEVADFWTTEDLVVQPTVNGVANGTAWDVSTLTFEPLNGVVDDVPGWPYRRICGGYGYVDHPLVRYLFRTGATLTVTAKWGWESVPAGVQEATLLLAAMSDKAKDAPFGVTGFGDYAVRINSNPMAREKLEPYRLHASAANDYLAAS